MPLLFVHIPKNAGSSIIHSIPKLHIVNHFPNYHRSSDRIDRQRMNVLNKIPSIKKFTSFAIKRNPYTRFISAYYYLYNGGIGSLDWSARDKIRSYPDINAFIANLPHHMERIVHLLPQHVFICRNGRIVVDHVLAFEDLPNCLSQISSAPLKHVNHSKKRHDQLTEESVRMLQQCYKEDFDIFGYDMSDISVLQIKKKNII